MRALSISTLILLGLTTTASADVGLPGFKFTSGSRVVHFGPEVERYRVFAVCHDRCVSVGMGADHTANYPHLGPRGYGESLCAIPADTPVPENPTVKWLKSVPQAIWSEPFGEELRRDYVFFVPREGYVLHYQATFSGDKLELKLIDEHTEWSWPGVIAMGFVSVAIALGGIWLVRRLRRKSAPRTTPPPSN